jgi:hypothetical protein
VGLPFLEWAAAFESKLLELIAIAHIEDEEFVATLQPIEQFSRGPDFVVHSFRHWGSFRHYTYFGWGTIRR